MVCSLSYSSQNTVHIDDDTWHSIPFALNPMP